jgi:DNA-binding response OmpR family regulator
MTAGRSRTQRFALIVDDNPHAAAVSRALLEAAGWTVEWASDGFEAILRFRSRSYRALVLDYSLPGMDGVDVLSWVRRNLTDAPEVVVVSSECSEFLEKRFAGLGVRAILPKPLAAADLVLALEAA